MSLNVLHVRASTGFGGVENLIVETCKYIDTERFQCSIYTTFPAKIESNFLSELASKENVPCHVFQYSNRFSLDSIRAFLRYLDEKQIDIVHAHGYREGILTAIAAQHRDVATVATVHGWTAGKARKRVEIWAFRRLNRVIAVSPTIVSALCAAGMSEKRIVLVPNFVDTDRFCPKPKNRALMKEFGLSGQEYVIGTSARLSPEKGISDLIRAAQIVAKKCQKVKFLIVGDGPTRDQLQELANELDLMSFVRFTGYRSDLAEIYNLMDIYASPSLQEESPRSILEAAATALPISATDVGGVSQMIDSEVSGFLISPRRPQELASTILRCLSDKHLCDIVGQRARQRIICDFGHKRILEIIQNIYDEIKAPS